MKLTTVIGSVNNNPAYYKFIPKQIAFWRHFNINFVAIYIHVPSSDSGIPEELQPYIETGNIIIWDKTPQINTVFQAQMLRVLYAGLLALDDTELVMITDMDMLPCSAPYYTSGLADFEKRDFLYYRSISETNKEIYMCYNAAHPSVWSQIFGITSLDDISKVLTELYTGKDYSGIPGGAGWCIDQRFLYDKLINYPYLRVMNRPIKRLEVKQYNRLLQLGNTNFYHTFDDAHFHRNFTKNADLIANAEKQLGIKTTNI